MQYLLILILSLSFTLTAVGQNYPDSGFTNKAEAKNLMVNGLKEGKWCEYWDDTACTITTDTNTSMYILSIYKHDKEIGIARWYYHNGILEAEVPYKDGIEDGIEKTYYKNGILEQEIPVSNGKINGKVKWYYMSGIIMNVSLYTNGKEGQSINYDYTGKEIK